MNSIDISILFGELSITKLAFDGESAISKFRNNFAFLDEFRLLKSQDGDKFTCHIIEKYPSQIENFTGEFILISEKLTYEEMEKCFKALNSSFKGLIFVGHDDFVYYVPGGLNSPHLTLVIPVYNMEKWIVLLLSDFDVESGLNLEILFINDGSTDRSKSLINDWIDKSNFKGSARLIDKQNGGCASARNLGLSEARGKFVVFVDPDDRVFTDTFASSIFLAEIYSADILRTQNYTFFQQEMNTKFQYDDELLKAPRVIPNYSSFDLALEEPGIWRNLYRKSFLKMNALEFQLIPRFDDLGFTVKAALLAKKIVKTNIISYGYQLGRDGQDTAAGDERLLVVLEIYRDLVLFMQGIYYKDFPFRVIFLSKLGTYKWAYFKAEPSVRSVLARKFLKDLIVVNDLSLLSKLYCLVIDFRSHGWRTSKWLLLILLRSSFGAFKFVRKGTF